MHLIGHFYLFASYVLTRLRFFNVHFSQRWDSSSIRLAGWFSVWFNLYLSVLMWWHIGSLAIIIAPADDGTVRNWPKQINTYLENAILKVVCVCTCVYLCVPMCVINGLQSITCVKWQVAIGGNTQSVRFGDDSELQCLSFSLHWCLSCCRIFLLSHQLPIGSAPQTDHHQWLECRLIQKYYSLLMIGSECHCRILWEFVRAKLSPHRSILKIITTKLLSTQDPKYSRREGAIESLKDLHWRSKSYIVIRSSRSSSKSSRVPLDYDTRSVLVSKGFGGSIVI